MQAILEDADERSGVARLLAALFLAEPDPQVLTLLHQSPLFHGVDTADGLAEQYCRTFIGPRGHLPPIQSVWVAGQLDSEITSSARRYREIAGLTTEVAEPIDHLGLSLGCYGGLLQQVAATDATDTAAIADLIGSFLHDHLVWGIEYTARVARADQAPFYGQVAHVAGHFLADEKTRILQEV